MTNTKALDEAVRLATGNWYEGDTDALRRIVRAGKWGLRKRKIFTKKVRAEYRRVMAESGNAH